MGNDDILQGHRLEFLVAVTALLLEQLVVAEDAIGPQRGENDRVGNGLKQSPEVVL